MKLTPAHVGISVADMDESIAWYSEYLGFTLEFRKTFEILDGMEIAFLDLNGFRIELFHAPVPKAPPVGIYLDNSVMGVKHFALNVDDLEALMSQLTAKNVHVCFRTEMEGDLVCFIEDCSGTLIELIQPGGAK